MKGLRLVIYMLDEVYTRSPLTRILSRRHRPVGLASMVLSDAKSEIYKRFQPGLPVKIEYGYRDEAPTVWEGWTTTRKAVGDDQIEIGCIGVDRPMVSGNIKLAWENESPEAIVRHSIRLSGLTPGRVDAPGPVVFPKFIAGNVNLAQTVLQCAHTCQHAFGIDMSRWALWMDIEKRVVNWGDFDREGDVPVIESGSALLRHSPASDQRGLHQIETFLHAGFEHSRVFRLIDLRREIDREFRALSVRHDLSEQVRTFIEYGEEYDQL
jgi:hypothetical protein